MCSRFTIVFPAELNQKQFTGKEYDHTKSAGFYERRWRLKDWSCAVGRGEGGAGLTGVYRSVSGICLHTAVAREAKIKDALPPPPKQEKSNENSPPPSSVFPQIVIFFKCQSVLVNVFYSISGDVNGRNSREQEANGDGIDEATARSIRTDASCQKK